MTRSLLLSCLVVVGCDSEPSPSLEVEERAPAEVVAAVFEAIAASDEDALTALVREDYIQHSSLAADGLAGLLETVPLLNQLTITVHRQLVDGDQVALHSTYGFPDGSEQVAFDVFRVQDGQLAEHWDALQPLVATSETVSGRGMTDGPTVPDTAVDTEESRAIATGFVDTVLTQGQFGELTTYVSSDSYAQHNPLIDDGVDGIGAFVQALGEQGLTFYYTDSPVVVAQNDLVLIGSEGAFGPEGAPPYAVFYDLFRIEDGRIVEHWDVIPPNVDPDALPHDNGYF